MAGWPKKIRCHVLSSTSSPFGRRSLINVTLHRGGAEMFMGGRVASFCRFPIRAPFVSASLNIRQKGNP